MSQRREATDLGRLVGLGNLFSYMYCLMASMALVRSPLFGGALYMCAEISLVFFSTFQEETRGYFSRSMRRWNMALLAVLLLSTLALVLVYPRQLSNEQAWLVFALIAAMLLRDIVCRRTGRGRLNGRLGSTGYWALMAAGHVIPAVTLVIIYLANLPFHESWPLLAGYALCDLISLWLEIQYQEDQEHLRDSGSADTAIHLRNALKDTSAFRMYEFMVFLIVIGLELTTVLLFSVVARQAENLLLSLVLCVVTAFLAYALSETILGYRQRRRQQGSEPINVLLVGLVLWLIGLASFRRLKNEDMLHLSMYLSLGLTSAGCSLCMSAVGWLEKSMRAVARLAAGREPEGYDRMRTAAMDMAALMGQVLALGMMTLLIFSDRRRESESLVQVQPLLLFPALVLVFIALVCLLRFPISSRALGKLNRMEQLKDGSAHDAIQSELEETLLGRYRPFFSRIIGWIVRRTYPHKLIGVENIHQDEDNPIVFLSNHSEFYGALVSVAYLPVPSRLWIISQMSVDRDEVADYVYRNTFSHQRWLPKRLQMPFSRLVARFSVWASYQLGGIPVWRDKPVLLKRTFRASVDAMLAGDSILIFPENPNASEEGYAVNGISELFSGFAMLGQVYWMRAHKRCRFVPMLAHRETRTITFGPEIVYNPEAPIEQEIQRISDTCYNWMTAIWDQNEALARAQAEKKNRRTGGSDKS